MKKIRWGVLSTAKIGREKVIPAMQHSQFGEVTAIASRDPELGRAVASSLSIPKAYDSYEELLLDDDIDAVYIPLPNHMHIPWTIKALEAGKHVLCEKPIALSPEDGEHLLKVARQKPHLKVMEAFMYRYHPQWQQAGSLVASGCIGELKTIQSFFAYYNVDPQNIRNQKELGGGGMMDIGCYCVSLSRMLFGKEPVRVFGMMNVDPVLGTDRQASGILDFVTGTSTFTCSTQLTPFQRVNILGTTGRIEIEIPFNAPPDQVTRIWLHTAAGAEEFIFDPVDQYTLQGDAFSKSILDDTPVPMPLKDAINNMRVIEAVFQSSQSETWVEV
ncbi:Gfo/Idh/MocA family oxidoreductase [Paraflavisolibacter sp. H34]|uniref:Gfo/Idh/MocA family protein n=1 Tax=Huijunlia imazamoxiresistens TaxID=3127457 RepID=UPI0030174AF0